MVFFYKNEKKKEQNLKLKGGKKCHSRVGWERKREWVNEGINMLHACG